MRIEDFIKGNPDLKEFTYTELYKIIWHLKINGYLKENV